MDELCNSCWHNYLVAWTYPYENIDIDISKQQPLFWKIWFSFWHVFHLSHSLIKEMLIEYKNSEIVRYWTNDKSIDSSEKKMNKA